MATVTLRNRFVIFGAAFFFSLHLALITYLNTVFLSKMFSIGVVDMLFILGSTGSCVLLFFEPRVIHRLGVIHTALIALTLSAICLLCIGFHLYVPVVVLAFITYLALNTTIISLFDIALEHYSPRRRIGDIRGFYFTVMNASWVLAAVWNSKLLTKTNLGGIYLICAVLVLLAYACIRTLTKTFQDRKHQFFSLKDVGMVLRQKEKYSHVFIADMTLQTFYAVMVFFSALYLAPLFPLSTIALLYTIMLTPFLLLQYLFGRLCDRFRNEPRLIRIGFLVMAVSVLMFPLAVKDRSFFEIASVLFLSRVGAAIAEIALETYFFSVVHDNETAAIAVFRSLVPLSYLLVACLSMLFHAPYSIYFILIGILLLSIFFYIKRMPRLA